MIMSSHCLCTHPSKLLNCSISAWLVVLRCTISLPTMLSKVSFGPYLVISVLMDGKDRERFDYNKWASRPEYIHLSLCNWNIFFLLGEPCLKMVSWDRQIWSNSTLPWVLLCTCQQWILWWPLFNLILGVDTSAWPRTDIITSVGINFFLRHQDNLVGR